MEFIVSFHVKTNEDDLFLEMLQQYAGIQSASRVKYTDDLQDNLLADQEAYPDYLAIGRNSAEWVTVQYNSFKKLHDWGANLSQALSTLFLQTVYSPVNEYAYLLAYERGGLIREIEADKHSSTPVINAGRPFDFEKEQVLLFDLDALMDYCTYLGIDTINEQKGAYCTVLKSTTDRSCNVLFNMQRELAKAMKILEERTSLAGIKKMK